MCVIEGHFGLFYSTNGIRRARDLLTKKENAPIKISTRRCTVVMRVPHLLSSEFHRLARFKEMRLVTRTGRMRSRRNYAPISALVAQTVLHDHIELEGAAHPLEPDGSTPL
jgi:hypothetical protein